MQRTFNVFFYDDKNGILYVTCLLSVSCTNVNRLCHVAARMHACKGPTGNDTYQGILQVMNTYLPDCGQNLKQ